MAKPILVANWKNHPKSILEAKTLLKQLSKDRAVYKKAHLFIAPPLSYLDLVKSRTGNFASLSVQDFPKIERGVYTGEVSPDILKSFGVRLAIVGHSERRALGDTNESVAEKIKVAMRSGIVPLVCVGEISRDQDGEHFEFLREEIKFSLSGLKRKEAMKLVLAYEPVWAIGKETKDAISLADLAQSVIFIKKILADMFGRDAAEQIPILYGGSVGPANAKDLMKTGIRGFLVGHESLDAKSFKSIAISIV